VRRHRLREPFVYFVDECLGRHVVPDGLRGAIDHAERVEQRPQGTLDLEWIPEAASSSNWVCFTKDRALRRRPNELAALLRGTLATFPAWRSVWQGAREADRGGASDRASDTSFAGCAAHRAGRGGRERDNPLSGRRALGATAKGQAEDWREEWLRDGRRAAMLLARSAPNQAPV
jgi:hypothetical protein